mgnify:CR=1 FL=1
MIVSNRLSSVLIGSSSSRDNTNSLAAYKPFTNSFNSSIVNSNFIIVIFLSAILWGLSGVIYSTILSYFIGLLFYLPYFDRNNFFTFSSVVRKHTINKYSVVVFLGAVTTIFSQYSDIYLLNYLGVSADIIGYYAIATVFFMAGVTLTGTVQTVLTPYFSEKQHDLKWIRSKTLKYQMIVSLVSVATT